ncbi:uncharacterized protein FOMMEDRAFT_154819 [Fomitiporia mediterranea MF3/22]|uniref:uncharacterized protein n=1 Tax=Fomitiporia mediterranea (strain MF3/22) TaxID=694068 RepID=UPI0004407396|nr:uncharacterized protein FOMMEDRAFT_154819 [Fomitiporia mediterranea MF3/22]EJD03716.1 hypothetical protein FOMMEDRAFT_154819 [Fomitiporia mediterranea MF3/22]
MSVSQAELDGVKLIIEDSTTNGYAQLSSLAIVLFDYLLTFDDEVALVWKQSSWGVGSILFFANRYTGLFSLAFNSAIVCGCRVAIVSKEIDHDLNSCFHWVRYQIGSSIMAFWLVDMILALRVWALWGRSQYVTIFICSMFTVSIAFVAIVAGLMFQHITVMHRPGSFAFGCYPVGFPVWTFLLAIPEVLNSGVLLGMTLYRTIRTVRMGRRNAPLFMLFIKDGVLYYVCILIILLMNAFAFSSFTITAAASGLAIAIPNVFGSRILLNLRRQLLKQTTNPSVPSMQTMQFGVDGAAAERTTRSVTVTGHTFDNGEIEMQFTSVDSSYGTQSTPVYGETDKTERSKPVDLVVDIEEGR